MRMWGLPPSNMCRKHLLGEHVEMHMFVGAINKGKNIQGYINKGLVDVREIISRHDILVNEMVKRGYNHTSPLPSFNVKLTVFGEINILENQKELNRRCKDCRAITRPT